MLNTRAYMSVYTSVAFLHTVKDTKAQVYFIVNIISAFIVVRVMIVV